MRQNMNIADLDFQIDASIVLSENEVHLWRVDLESLRNEEARWQALLSADEKERASRFRFPDDRQRFAASRALLRTILGGYLTAPPRDLLFHYSGNQKPSLAAPFADSGIMFNLSHSGGAALYALTRGRKLGVDIERLGRNSDLEGIARRFFSASEQHELAGFSGEEKVKAFFRCWTRKEAYIKATGDGLSLPLSQFDVSLQAGSVDALLATRPDGAEAKNWQLREVAAGTGYSAALCIQGQDCVLKDWTGGAT
jgi:4'-phosphopantetheinyl transferase